MWGWPPDNRGRVPLTFKKNPRFGAKLGTLEVPSGGPRGSHGTKKYFQKFSSSMVFMVSLGCCLKKYWFSGQKQSFLGPFHQAAYNDLFWPQNQYMGQITTTSNHLNLNTIQGRKLWKYFLVPLDPLGASRVPNLALNRGIFSKVNGTSPLGSGGHPHTIFSNGRFYQRQSSFGGDVISNVPQ